MEGSRKKTIPQISLLKNEDDLEAWKLSVNEVWKFYGMKVIARDAGVRPRKRLCAEEDQATFLLGVLSASVSPVAQQLAKAGWDFSDSEQHPEDLYNHVLNVIVPASQLSATVAEIVMHFTLTFVPTGRTSL